MPPIVIIDSSPLIGLAIVDGLHWLPAIFGAVYITETVKKEVLPDKNAPGKTAIAHAIDVGWLTVWSEPINSLLDIDLDAGETDCINVALGHPDKVLLIMDERAVRFVAKEKGLNVTGNAAIISLAKKQALIPSAKAAFELLHNSDFRISATVINLILKNVGE